MSQKRKSDGSNESSGSLSKKDKAEDPYEALLTKVGDIFGRLNQASLLDLVAEFLALRISDEQQMKAVVDMIFEKALQERVLLNRIVQLCLDVQNEEWDKPEMFERSLGHLLTEKLFAEFGKIHQDATQYASGEKQRRTAGLLLGERNKMHVVMTFIGELYKQHFLFAMRIGDCLKKLSSCLDKDESMVECMCILLKIIGPKLDRMEESTWVNAFYDKLSSSKSAVSNRLQCMVDDVLDFHKNEWQFKQGQLLEMNHFQLSMNGIKHSADNSWLSSRRVFPLVIDFTNPKAAKESLSDVALSCDGKVFNCHRVFLAQNSPTFERMFTGDFAESETRTVEIGDLSEEVATEILRFIYCGYIEKDLARATPEVQHEFLYAAVKYDLEQLVDLILLAIYENLDAVTACRYLLFAERFDLAKLKEACFKIMSKHANRRIISDSEEWDEISGNKNLRLNQAMKSHVAYSHRSWRFGCCQCLRRFFAKPELVHHCIEAHSAQIAHQVEQSLISSDYDNDSSHTFRLSRSKVTYAYDKLQHGCAQCLKRFYAKPVLVRHCIKSHGMEVAPCAEFETIPNASFDCIDFLRTRKSMWTRIARGLKCQKCERVCAREDVFEEHCKRAHDYGCANCPRRFVTKHLLVPHCQQHFTRSTRKMKCSMPNRTFGCSECLSFFTAKRSLVEHLVKTHKRAIAGAKHATPCQYCGQYFEDDQSMSAHMRLMHSDLFSFACFYCPKKFPSEDAKYEHEICIHRTSDFIKCDFCAKKFFHANTKEDHVTRCHLEEACGFGSISGFQPRTSPKAKNESKRKERVKRLCVVRPKMHYACVFCSKLFSNRLIWAMHLRTVHSQDRPFVCEHCGKTFRYPRGQRDHVVKKHKCGHCDFLILDAQGKPQRVVLPKITLSCEFCSMPFSSQNSWVVHMRTVHQQYRPFVCEHCGENFCNAQTKWRHVTRFHRCLFCDAVIADEFERAAHMRSVHSKPAISKDGLLVASFRSSNATVRPFKCDQCAKAFSLPALVQLHVRIAHTPRYHCTDCGEGFTKKAKLLRHRSEDHPADIRAVLKALRAKQPETMPREIRIKCGLCEEWFASFAQREQHVTGYHAAQPLSCEFCFRTFTNNAGRLSHVRSAHCDLLGIASHSCVCRVCQETFPTRSARQHHEITKHLQTVHFKCDYCANSFANKALLRSHVCAKSVWKQCGKLSNAKDTRTEHPKTEQSAFAKGERYCGVTEQEMDDLGRATGAAQKHANAADVHFSALFVSAVLPSTASSSANKVPPDSVDALLLDRFAASTPKAVSSSLPAAACASGLKNVAARSVSRDHVYGVSSSKVVACRFCLEIFESEFAVRSHECHCLRRTCRLCKLQFLSSKATASHLNRLHGLGGQRRAYGSAQIQGVQCLDATIAELAPPCNSVANAVSQQPAVIKQPCTPMLQSRDLLKPAHPLAAAQQRPLILRLASPLTSARLAGPHASQRIPAGASAAQSSLPSTTSSCPSVVRIPSTTATIRLVKIGNSGNVALLRKESLDGRQLVVAAFNKDMSKL